MATVPSPSREEALLEKEQVVASFSRINWDDVGRMFLEADEVSTRKLRVFCIHKTVCRS
jgi:hypothetical protein